LNLNVIINYSFVSFARKFKIEATERNCIGLENTEREGAVHVEGVFADTSELHVDFGVVVLVYELKVLDTGLVDAPVEVQDEGLHLLVPLGRFIEEEHKIFGLVGRKLSLYRVSFDFRVGPEVFLAISTDHRHENLHSSGTFATKYICFILHHSV